MKGFDEGRGSWTLPQRSLTQLAVDRIAQAIRSGEFAPGERLVETRIAKMLGVSRGPLREALKALEAEGLVESRRGRGTYVAEISTSDAVQMIALRAVLEGLAARLVAAQQSPDVIAQLTEIHAGIEEAARKGQTRRWRDLDWKFHETICRCSGNDFLFQAWQSISSLVRMYLHRQAAFERDVPGVLANHVAFLAAIRSGDPDEAERVFRGRILGRACRDLGMALPAGLNSYLVPEPKRPARATRAGG
jgi:DNA-binding GntR family transcriptional regulator